MIYRREEGGCIRNGFNICKIKPRGGYTFHLRVHRFVMRLRIRGRYKPFSGEQTWPWRERVSFEAIIWPKEIFYA